MESTAQKDQGPSYNICVQAAYSTAWPKFLADAQCSNCTLCGA